MTRGEEPTLRTPRDIQPVTTVYSILVLSFAHLQNFDVPAHTILQSAPRKILKLRSVGRATLKRNQSPPKMMRTADHDIPLVARYRQQWDERNIPLQYGHAGRQNLRSCPVARPDRSREPESESNGTTTRRRIAVACSRCRKRKIKCSGDPGNGMGCQNCRSAGADSCTFYRVGSSEISLLPSQPLGGHVIGYSSTPNLGMFHVYQQPPHNYPCYPRPYSQGSSLSISTRSLPPSDWTPIHSDSDSPVDGYPLQPAAIMTGTQPYGPLYSAQMSRSWTSLSERSTTGINNYVEKEPSTHSMPFMSAAIGPRQPGPTEDTSPFNVFGLQSPLPQSSTSKRQLPIPSPALRQIVAPLHTEACQIHPANATSQTGREANVALYSSGSWATENYPTDCRENSVGCGASISQSGVMSTTASTAPASTTETSPRSCAEPISSPVASQTPIRPSRTMSTTTAMTTLMNDAAPAPAPASASPVATQTPTLSYIGNYGSQSSEQIVHRNGSVSDLLSYQLGMDKPSFHDEVPSEADTLSNGQRYELIAQPQHDRVANARNLRRESWKNSAVLARQTSVTERNY